MSLEQSQADAYRDGKAACRSGHFITACPYGPGREREDWLQGWRAEMQIRTGREAQE
jgi:ribosome modulation factor